MKEDFGDRTVRFPGAIEDTEVIGIPATASAGSVEGRSALPDHAPDRTAERYAVQIPEGIEETIIVRAACHERLQIDAAVQPLDNFEDLGRPALIDQIVRPFPLELRMG